MSEANKARFSSDENKVYHEIVTFPRTTILFLKVVSFCQFGNDIIATHFLSLRFHIRICGNLVTFSAPDCLDQILQMGGGIRTPPPPLPSVLTREG